LIIYGRVAATRIGIIGVAVMRIGLSLTAPIIAALISSPKDILSLVGVQYISGESMLVVLSIAILPFSIVTTTISKFDFLGQSNKLIIIGVIQIIAFLVPFFLLTPQYKGLGVSFSILMGYITPSLPAVIWSDRSVMRYIVVSVIAVILGWSVGYATATTVGHLTASLTAAFITTAKHVLYRDNEHIDGDDQR
jgi:hypothetical protein